MYYSNVFLKENPLLFLYILLFIILNGFLVVLCLWQFIAFGSYHKPQYFKGDLYYLSGQSTVLQVLNAIEFIWGIQFLRDSCTPLTIKSTISSQATPSSGISTSGKKEPPSAAALSPDSSARISGA